MFWSGVLLGRKDEEGVQSRSRGDLVGGSGPRVAGPSMGGVVVKKAMMGFVATFTIGRPEAASDP